MISSRKDRAKVAIYIKLWEEFNKAVSLIEFERSIITKIYKNSRFSQEHIKEVLKDFFETNGIKLDIQCDDDVICFHKKILNEEENVYTEFIGKHFSEPRKFLIRVPKKSNLYYLESEQVDKILSYIEDPLLGNSEKQEIVKGCLRVILKLDKRDAIFFVNDKLFVRFFLKNLSKGCEKRFNGIPEDEMEKLFEKFKDINYEHLVENIAENIISKYLSPQDVDNMTFHRKMIPLFQKSLNSVFKKHIEEPELLIGFTNYILRQNFNAALYYIANVIIDLIQTKDDNVKKFISFYDGSEFTEEGKKYRKSEIIVNNERWSYPLIFNLVSQKVHVENQFFTKEDEVSSLEEHIVEVSEKIEIILRDLERKKIELEDLKMIAESNHKLISKLRKDFQKLQIEAKKKEDPRTIQSLEIIKRDIKKSSEEDAEIIKRREELTKEIDKLVIERIDLEKKVDGAKQKIKHEMEKTEEMKENYLDIKTKLDEVVQSFALALMSFKI